MTEQGFYAFAQTRPNESVKWSTESVIAPEPWMSDGACREVVGDLFFPDRSDARTIRDAKKICDSCPVAAQCLEYAIRNNERLGTWGGLTEWERARKGLHNTTTRTHCREGHEFTEENTYTTAAGARACRKCRAAWSKEWRAKNS